MLAEPDGGQQLAVRRVSSAITRSTSASTRSARRLRSSRFPIARPPGKDVLILDYSIKRRFRVDESSAILCHYLKVFAILGYYFPIFPDFWGQRTDSLPLLPYVPLSAMMSCRFFRFCGDF